MRQPKISVVIVTWHGASYIESCLDSVLRQNIPADFSGQDEEGEGFPWFDILVVDNGSDDGTREIVEAKYQGKVKIVKNKFNQGFARGYNQAIHWTSGRYVLLLNQDVVLEENYLLEASSFLDSYKEVAVVAGTILKWDYNNQRFTDIIDSLGININKNFRFTNTGEGERWLNKKPEIKPVFGFSGAVALMRRQALYDVAYEKQFFDEAFWSYKEDVDLSWRLRWRNWDIVHLPQAIAYHKRSISKVRGADSMLKVAYHYGRKQQLINYLSYRNHLLVLIKNLPLGLFWLYFLPLGWYEFTKIVYLIFRRPNILFAWLEVFKNLPSLLAKRRFIRQSRKIKVADIKVWLQ